MPSTTSGIQVRIVLAYAFFGSCWILFSDTLLRDVISEVSLYAEVQTVKGWLFMAITSLGLYWLLKRELSRREQLEMRYQELFDASPDALFVTGRNDWIRAVNRTALERYGYGADELRAMRFAELSVPEVREAGGPGPYEGRHRTRDGSEFPVEVYSQSVCGSCEERLLNSVRDITERKQSEEEVRQLNAELELRVAARTAELNAKNQELETFAYSVSHDLKAPLRGIEGYSHLLVRDHAEELTGEAQLFAQNIQKASVRMAQLIDDLLAYSRFERRRLARSELALRPFIETLIDECGVRGRAVEYSLQVPDVRVVVDPDGLAVALRNLLDNALKFTRNEAATRIVIEASELKAAWAISVSDNGPGFDMAQRERIFEVFQQLHPVGVFPGTGIGLAMVRKAMERMGGRSWAESAPGGGATFTIEFPKEFVCR